MTLLFTNGLITVEMNSSNEVFVTNVETRVTVRIGKYGKDLKLTCNAQLSPTIINGCAGIAAWSVK
jgi:hypothetical protein